MRGAVFKLSMQVILFLGVGKHDVEDERVSDERTEWEVGSGKWEMEGGKMERWIKGVVAMRSQVASGDHCTRIPEYQNKERLLCRPRLAETGTKQKQYP
jgi:hypothetical protein